ncbi:MAG: DUF3307 domain-containing protein [Salinibacterium sp.]|nr:DUF3307 domain-containing protein [Salinibacterium sp.]
MVSEILFLLLVGHALADYPLQGDFIGKFKSWRVPPPPGMPRTTWAHLLTAHSLIHAGAVLLITGSLALALCEFVAHWIIDALKCAGITGLHTDQLLHVACKVAWWLAVIGVFNVQ